MRRAICHAFAALVLLAAVPSCAAILGDDFKIDDDGDEGSASGKQPCPTPNCDTCTQCSCPGFDDCFVNEMTACSAVVQCITDCQMDPTCADECRYNGGAGTEQLDAVFACACEGECFQVCSTEGVCVGGA